MKNTAQVINRDERIMSEPSIVDSVRPEYNFCMRNPNRLPAPMIPALAATAEITAIQTVLMLFLCPRRMRIPRIVAMIRDASITSLTEIRNDGIMSEVYMLYEARDIIQITNVQGNV